MAKVDYVQGKMNTYQGLMDKVLWAEGKATEYTKRANDYKVQAREVLELVGRIKALLAEEQGHLLEAEKLKSELSGAENVNEILAKIDESRAKATEVATKVRALYYAG